MERLVATTVVAIPGADGKSEVAAAKEAASQPSQADLDKINAELNKATALVSTLTGQIKPLETQIAELKKNRPARPQYAMSARDRKNRPTQPLPFAVISVRKVILYHVVF